MEKEEKKIFEQEKYRVIDFAKTVAMFTQVFKDNVKSCDSRRMLFEKVEKARSYLQNYCRDLEEISDQININDELF